MTEQSGGAGDTAREMREHEREARERDPGERDPATGVPGDADTDSDNPGSSGQMSRPARSAAAAERSPGRAWTSSASSGGSVPGT